MISHVQSCMHNKADIGKCQDDTLRKLCEYHNCLSKVMVEAVGSSEVLPQPVNGMCCDMCTKENAPAMLELTTPSFFS